MPGQRLTISLKYESLRFAIERPKTSDLIGHLSRDGRREAPRGGCVAAGSRHARGFVSVARARRQVVHALWSRGPLSCTLFADFRTRRGLGRFPYTTGHAGAPPDFVHWRPCSNGGLRTGHADAVQTPVRSGLLVRKVPVAASGHRAPLPAVPRGAHAKAAKGFGRRLGTP